MGSPAKTDRNRRIGRDYRAGLRMTEIAERYGIALSRVSVIVKAQGQSLSPLGRVCRTAVANRRKAADEAYRARQRAATQAAWDSGRMQGRRGKGA